MPRSFIRRSLRQHYLACGVVCALSILVTLAGCRYFKADRHVAFLGDSLIEDWNYPRENLGKLGSTTADMLTRIQIATAGHKFTKVVILGGTNDVLRSVDAKTTIRNLETIATAIQQSGEEPVLCEIPPIFHSNDPVDRRDFSVQVSQLDGQIEQLAVQHGWKLVDYYHPMLGHPDYSVDGVHMRRRGYLVMEMALRRAVPDA